MPAVCPLVETQAVSGHRVGALAQKVPDNQVQSSQRILSIGGFGKERWTERQRVDFLPPPLEGLLTIPFAQPQYALMHAAENDLIPGLRTGRHLVIKQKAVLPDHPAHDAFRKIACPDEVVKCSTADIIQEGVVGQPDQKCVKQRGGCRAGAVVKVPILKIGEDL